MGRLQHEFKHGLKCTGTILLDIYLEAPSEVFGYSNELRQPHDLAFREICNVSPPVKRYKMVLAETEKFLHEEHMVSNIVVDAQYGSNILHAKSRAYLFINNERHALCCAEEPSRPSLL
jgi:hypothetical protein